MNVNDIRNNLGLIHIYCGEGKGKTTAAIGLGIRAVGNGLNVVMCQFLKSEISGEINILKNIRNFKVITNQKKFPFSWLLTDEDKAELKQIHNNIFNKAIGVCKEGKCDLLILDEIISTYNYDLIDKDMVIDFLKNKPENIEIVLTGRKPEIQFIKMSDYITDMSKIKHPYQDKNIKARYGIEL